jgi:hypothetical protein
MDSEYRAIFERLYQPVPDPSYDKLEYRLFAWSPYLQSEDGIAVRQAIDAADAELLKSSGRKIRADAKYFLFLNLMEMVFLPMQIRGRSFREELGPALRADLNLLVNDAVRLQERRERIPGEAVMLPQEPELSGHSVLEAIALNWRQLKLSDLRVWGDD